MLKNCVLAVGLAFAITACDVPAPTASQASAPVIGPGDQLLSPTQAAQLFKTICVDQRPSFRGTPAAAKANGFVQDPKSEIFFDGRRNISFKLVRGDCSVVFVSTLGLRAVMQAFAPYTSRVREVPVDGTVYYNARISG